MVVGRWSLVVGLFFQASLLPAQSRALTTERFADLERVASPRISPDGKSIVFTRWHVDSAQDRWVASLWLMDANGAHPRELGAGSTAEWSPDGKRLAYLDDVDGVTRLRVRPADGSVPSMPLSDGATTPSAMRWSPDGQLIAFVMKTSTGAAHLFVVAADGGTIRDLTPDFQLRNRQADMTGFDWLPDGKSLLVGGRNSAATDSSTLQLVDVATATRRPFLAQGGWQANPVVSPDGKSVVYLGRSTSGSPSVVYTAKIDGTLPHVVVPDVDREIRSLVWSDKETIWFTTDDHGARNTWTASTTAKTPAVKSGSNGSHWISLGDVTSRGAYGVAVRSSPERPEEVERFALKKPALFTQLSHVNDDFLAAVHTGEVEEVLTKSADGVPIQGWLVKPPEFDLSRKWPLLVRLSNGPGHMTTLDFNATDHHFAAQGMVVLTLNPRGAAGYGAAFATVDPDSLLTIASRDVLSMIDNVLANNYTDTTRLYLEGGTLAASLLGHSTRFRAAVLKASNDPPPLDGAPASWLARWPVSNLAAITTPTLFAVDGPEGSIAGAQFELLFAALQTRGVPSMLVRITGEETPSSWRRMQAIEAGWWKRE